MENIAVYTLTSPLHDAEAVSAISDGFLASIFPSGGYDFRGGDFSDFGTHALDLIFVRTGGTEGIFRSLLPRLRESGATEFRLLASDRSNSLAASMEILSFLRLNGIRGEIIHGSAAGVAGRIDELLRVAEAKSRLAGMRLGVIGRPSDWLIASGADYRSVKEKLGVELVDVPVSELTDRIAGAAADEAVPDVPMPENVRKAFPGALGIYRALKSLVKDRGLGGFTLRCFDLLDAVGNTGCLALAKLNSEGMPAGCEGDVPALLSMTVAKAVTGFTGFQANPSRIDPASGEILFAHCTIPLDIVDSVEYDTHFESGKGVGIRGHYPEGPVTVFKLSGDLSRHFLAEGELIRNCSGPDLCRTQIVVRLSPEEAGYFLREPIGNHHIILPGHCRTAIESII